MSIKRRKSGTGAAGRTAYRDSQVNANSADLDSCDGDSHEADSEEGVFHETLHREFLVGNGWGLVVVKLPGGQPEITLPETSVFTIEGLAEYAEDINKVVELLKDEQEGGE
jgi:hypothetical protein